LVLNLLCKRPVRNFGKQLLLNNKNETRTVAPGSEAFFHVDVSRVRRSASRQLPISTEAAPPLSPTVFFLKLTVLFSSQPL